MNYEDLFLCLKLTLTFKYMFIIDNELTNKPLKSLEGYFSKCGVSSTTTEGSKDSLSVIFCENSSFFFF